MRINQEQNCDDQWYDNDCCKTLVTIVGSNRIMLALVDVDLFRKVRKAKIERSKMQFKSHFSPIVSSSKVNAIER